MAGGATTRAMLNAGCCELSVEELHVRALELRSRRNPLASIAGPHLGAAARNTRKPPPSCLLDRHLSPRRKRDRPTLPPPLRLLLVWQEHRRAIQQLHELALAELEEQAKLLDSLPIHVSVYARCLSTLGDEYRKRGMYAEALLVSLQNLLQDKEFDKATGNECCVSLVPEVLHRERMPRLRCARGAAPGKNGASAL